LWAQAPQLAAGWQPLGGQIIAPPAVAAATGTSSTPDPLFIATGTDRTLWIRSATDGWQQVGTARCTGGPGAAVTGSTLTVACRGTDNALWYNTATMPASGLPAFTGPWASLGGVLSAAPAVALVNGTVTFFARGTSGSIYTRTLTAGYTQTPWACIGAPAAALVPGSGATMFACQGSDRALWQSDSLGGAPWTAAVSLGGVLVGGPAVVAGSQETDFLAEGTDHAIWQRTPAGWTGLGGSAVGGVGAVGLTMPAAPAWGNAIQVPGTAALSTNDASTVSVSCPSAGNCSAGGSYTDSSGNSQAFVADEVSGTWQNAIEVPGTAALNAAGGAGVFSVSCPTAGNCAASGDYEPSAGDAQAFVADEVNGTWHNAIEVPGTAALNTGTAGGAIAFSVSCPTAGNCTLGGSYTDSSGHTQAFVADEVNGTWHNAIEVPGTAALNTGNASVQSVSCASAGNCAVGGFYSSVEGANGFTQSQAFVADEVNGNWGNATQVPGTAALDTGGIASVGSVSCGSAGNCAASGSYTDSGGTQAFVANEANGNWGKAIQVPGTAALNTGKFVTVNSVSCPSANNCAAGGYYIDSASNVHAFVTDEVNGSWDNAIQVAGTEVSPDVVSVSCASAGNCVAGGGSSEAFVVSEVNGSWGNAIQVPGTPAVSTFSSSAVLSVSCPQTGGCAAGGDFHDLTSAGIEAFVVNQN
jgi:hypothetical protein